MCYQRGETEKAVKDHLARLNGSVARHEEVLNENKLWQSRSKTCDRRSQNQTIHESVAMICGTLLTIYGVNVTGIGEALVVLQK